MLGSLVPVKGAIHLKKYMINMTFFSSVCHLYQLSKSERIDKGIYQSISQLIPAGLIPSNLLVILCILGPVGSYCLYRQNHFLGQFTFAIVLLTMAIQGLKFLKRSIAQLGIAAGLTPGTGVYVDAAYTMKRDTINGGVVVLGVLHDPAHKRFHLHVRVNQEVLGYVKKNLGTVDDGLNNTTSY
jgi:hypothetical protein